MDHQDLICTPDELLYNKGKRGGGAYSVVAWKALAVRTTLVTAGRLWFVSRRLYRRQVLGAVSFCGIGQCPEWASSSFNRNCKVTACEQARWTLSPLIPGRCRLQFQGAC